MRILLCSSYMPADLIPLFRFASEAANHFLENLIANLKKENEVRLLSYYGFPKEGKWTREVEASIRRDGISFVVKKEKISILLSPFLYLWKAVRSMRNTDWIVFYNYTWVQYGVLFFARLLGIKTALILADHSDIHSYTSFFRRLAAKKNERDFLHFSALIILSHRLYETIPHEKKLFFPGGIAMRDFTSFSESRTEHCRFLYAGLLSDVTGVDLYLSAIQAFPARDVQFIFTGRGPLEDKINDLAMRDSRVVYKGFLSREAYHDLLNHIDVVVNPRNMNLPENRNNFPSKVMEYLASGRSIVSTRFMYWEEFPKTIHFCDATSESIKEGLQKAYADWEKGISSFSVHRDFAAQYDWRIQTERLRAFLEESS